MNCVFYCAYLPYLTDKTHHNQESFSQLYYSLKTLYETGYDKGVFLYYDADVDVNDFVYKEKYNLTRDFKNLICVKFKYKEWDKTETAFHKWHALMAFSKNFAFNRVLCIDNDTVFNKNPEHLFTHYSDPNVFYGVRYKWLDLDPVQKQIGMKGPSLNTGQYIISRQIINSLGVDFLNDLLREYYKFQLLTSQYQPENKNSIKWLGEEQAATKVLENKNILIEQLSDEHVTISKIQKTSTLCHYYSCNTKKIIPVEYWSEFTKNRNDN